MYLLSQKLELEPQHLWKLRSPKASLRYACFLRGIQSLDFIFHLISSKYQIIDPYHNHGIIYEKKRLFMDQVSNLFFPIKISYISAYMQL